MLECISSRDGRPWEMIFHHEKHLPKLPRGQVSRFHAMESVTLPETNSLHLRMDGWNTSFLFGPAYFLFSGGTLTFRECKASEQLDNMPIACFILFESFNLTCGNWKRFFEYDFLQIYIIQIQMNIPVFATLKVLILCGSFFRVHSYTSWWWKNTMSMGGKENHIPRKLAEESRSGCCHPIFCCRRSGHLLVAGWQKRKLP